MAGSRALRELHIMVLTTLKPTVSLQHLARWIRHASGVSDTVSKGDSLCSELRALMQRVSTGDRDKAIQRHRSRNKLLARERISMLLDPGYALASEAYGPTIARSTMDTTAAAPGWEARTSTELFFSSGLSEDSARFTLRRNSQALMGATV